MSSRIASSLRVRLAISYAGLLGIIIALTSLFSFSFHSAFHYADVDRSLAGTAAHAAAELRSAGPRLDASYLPPVEEFASPDIYLRLYDPDGRVVASSPNAGRQVQVDPRIVASAPAKPDQEDLLGWLMRSVTSPGQPGTPGGGGFLTATAADGRDRTRLYAAPLSTDGVLLGYLEAGASLNRLDESMERLRLLLGAMGIVGLMAALLGGWAIAASALRPVHVMANTARAIALSRGFSRRLPELGRRDELGHLAGTFNEMLASLDEAYRAQQRFVADASHELRTPLTAIQGNLELLERAPDAPDAERAETIHHLRKEAERMSRLVSDLLILARADAGQSARLRRLELDRLLLGVLRDASAMATGQKVSLRTIDQVEIMGDPDLLRQLLLILMDNALRYTPEGGEITLGLHTEPGAAVITVSDTGIGIDSNDLPHIFERFYRADKARAKEKGGTGLGLSIARWIADQHGGDISAESKPGSGSTFTVRLPLPPASRQL